MLPVQLPRLTCLVLLTVLVPGLRAADQPAPRAPAPVSVSSLNYANTPARN